MSPSLSLMEELSVGKFHLRSVDQVPYIHYILCELLSCVYDNGPAKFMVQ